MNRDPNTLIIGRPTDAISLDPARPTDNESVEVLDQVYDKLLRYRPGSNTIEPSLATSWKVHDMGRSWVFELRRGVTFHDGTPFNADAVVFSFERQRDPFHPFHRKFVYWANVYRNIVKVEKLGEFKVRIEIERPYAPFEANLAMFPVSIVSPTAVAKYGDSAEFERHPVGTGAYKLTSWTRGERIVLERNRDYWGGMPATKRIVFQVIPDPRQRLIALESGAIDIAYSILPEELQFVELHPNLVLHKVAANNVAYVALNTSRPPFDNVKVRRAANWAINKDPLVKMMYQGMAIPAYGALPPSQWAYHKVKEQYPYDPQTARQLLAEARATGVSLDKTFTFYVPTTPRPYLPHPERIGRAIQANLAAVGIKTRLVLQDFKTHLSDLANGRHDLALTGWVGDNGDPDNFLYLLFHKDNTVKGLARNVSFFTDPDKNGLNGLLVMAQESDDRNNRRQLYGRVQEILASEAPWVPLAHAQVAVAARDDIGGLVISPSSLIYYKDVRRISR